MHSRPGRCGRTRRLVAMGASVAIAAAVIGACGTTSSGDSITVYSGQHEQTTQALAQAFHKRTGVTVNLRFGDEDALADQIATEGSRSPADVFYTENSPPLDVSRTGACWRRSSGPPCRRHRVGSSRPRARGSASRPVSA